MTDTGWILFFFLLPFLAGGVIVLASVIRDAVLSFGNYDDHMNGQLSSSPAEKPRMVWAATR